MFHWLFCSGDNTFVHYVFNPSIWYQGILSVSNTKNPRFCNHFYKETFQQNDVEWRTIKHCRKSLIFSNTKGWKKKSTHSCVNATIGSYEDGKICKLVGNYTLSKQENITSKPNIGLYHDDSLYKIIWELNGQQTYKIRTNIVKVIKTIEFQTKIETNFHKINFLDITFNLEIETYRS